MKMKKDNHLDTKQEILDLGIPFAVELERLLLDKYGWEVDYGAILIIFDEIKQHIKQACEFYLRYKDNPELLLQKHEELRTEFRDTFGNVIVAGEFMIPFYDWKDKYNEWLFKLAFKSVFEEVKGK